MKIRQQNRIVRREKETFLKLFVSAVVTLSVFERYYLPFALFFHLLVIYCLSTHYTSREPGPLRLMMSVFLCFLSRSK